MIRVLEADTEAAVVLEEALEDREQTLQERLTDLQEEVNQARSEADSISAVLEEVANSEGAPDQSVIEFHGDDDDPSEVVTLTNDLLADN
jgi:uncharacterized protein YlxW (UPF0749 family)